LGLALAERFHVNILKTGLAALGLHPGPWLTRFKNTLYAGADLDMEFAIEPAGRAAGRKFELRALVEKIARITPGRKVAYVTDVGDSSANREAIVKLARDSDQLFIEAAFLHSERERAAATHHLTARQAGELAALARARHFTLFHFSPRYEGRQAQFIQEAHAAYQETLARVGKEHRAKSIGP
jgi:ribonuclease Z